jgi:hypothetical protein
VLPVEVTEQQISIGKDIPGDFVPPVQQEIEALD